MAHKANMTLEDIKCQNYLWAKLRQQGYVTYAKYFMALGYHAHSIPGRIAWINGDDGCIYVNRGLDVAQASVVVRHEILHYYLKHFDRALSHYCKQHGYNQDALDDATLDEILEHIYDPAYGRLSNIAADFEISNMGYTPKDKQAIRNINLNGRIVSGLITEDQHEDWTTLSFEEMWDKLEAERMDTITDGLLLDSTTFMDPVTGIVYGV